MKFLKGVFLVCLSLILLQSVSFASGWEDIWQNLSTNKEITPGQPVSATAYNATVTFTIYDGNSFANDFDDKDSIDLVVEGGGEHLTFSGSKQELIDWAEDNADALLQAIFGNAPEVSFSGMTASQYAVQMLFTNVYTSPEHTNFSFVPVSNKDIVITGQYDFMELGKDDVKAVGTSGILSYDHKFGEDNSNSIGIAIPYRQLELDDDLDSSYQFLALMPLYRHRWYMPNSLVEWIVNLSLNLTYLESSIFPDGSGYIEYGGGTGVKYAYAFNSALSMNVGLTYQGLKRNIPSDFVPDELEWVADAIDDLPVEHDLTPSIGVYYNIIPNRFSLRGEAFRVHQLQADVDSDYETQTVLLGIMTYKFSMADISLGYKRSFEMKDIDDQSVIASLRLHW